MIITAELSLYPLTKDYEAMIIDFIKSLRSNSDIEVLTHAMSTFVKGESKAVFSAINNAVNASYNKSAFSLNIKVINRDLPIERGFLNFD